MKLKEKEKGQVTVQFKDNSSGKMKTKSITVYETDLKTLVSEFQKWIKNK